MTPPKKSNAAQKLQFQNSPMGKELAEIKELFRARNAVVHSGAGPFDAEARESIKQRLELVGRSDQKNKPLQDYISDLKRNLTPSKYHHIQDAVDAIDHVVNLYHDEEHTWAGDFRLEIQKVVLKLQTIVKLESDGFIEPMIELQKELIGFYEVMLSLEALNDEEIYDNPRLSELVRGWNDFRKEINRSWKCLEELEERFKVARDSEKIISALANASQDAFGKTSCWYHRIIPALQNIQRTITRARHFCQTDGKGLSGDLKRQMLEQKKAKQVEEKVQLVEESLDGHAIADSLDILQSNPRVKQYYDALGGMPECTPGQIRKVHGGHKDTVKRNLLRLLEPVAGFRLVKAKKVAQKGVKYDTISTALLMANGGSGK